MSPALEGDGAGGVVPLPLVGTGPATRVVVSSCAPGDVLPHASWTGLWDGGTPGGGATRGRLGMPLLGEHTHDLFTRPHLRGHRVRDGGHGLDWSTRFEVTSVTSVAGRWVLEAADLAAGLALVLELESAAGGVLRARGTVRNAGHGAYALEGFEIVLPARDHLDEVLDLTGRHERERTPQRHLVTDGLWLRESRGGRPGLGSPTLVTLGTQGFATTYGEVLACHVAWSGSSVLRVERSPEVGTTVGGGELLLPGEVVLGEGESYTTPWVLFAAADDGLDGLAAAWHAYQRALDAHPAVQPVVLNCWEAVYFDHDPAHLRTIADRAARVGVERFVLDDGWFLGRRDDTAGLGDWEVDQTVWPRGLEELADHVRSLGMEFGLWFEPEMVNPRSRLFEQHPDWVLATGGRLPLESRHQQVLDLSRAEVRDHLFEQVSAVVGRLEVDYVKWDHNRELLDAGTGTRGGAPALRAQTLGYYDLLDRLAAAHPRVAWESCASGGGRIDLGVAERVQRFWTSDMTDALARQQIQRWTVQLVAPELIGAHVSAPVSPHHRPHPGPRLPLRDRVVRSVRDRVGPHRGRRGRARPPRDVGRAAQAVPPAPARGSHGPAREPRPHGAPARGGLARRARGAGRARAAGRVGQQPWRHRPGAWARPRRAVRAGLGGPGRAPRGQQVTAAPAGRPDRRRADDRPGAGDDRVLGPAPPARDGHPRAPPSGQRLSHAAAVPFRVRPVDPVPSGSLTSSTSPSGSSTGWSPVLTQHSR